MDNKNATAQLKGIFNSLENGKSLDDIAELDDTLENICTDKISLTDDDIEGIKEIINEDYETGEMDFNGFLKLLISAGKKVLDRDAAVKFKEIISSCSEQSPVTKSLPHTDKAYKFYRKRSPVVLGHFVDTLRVSGLTTRQLVKHAAKLMTPKAKPSSSPYSVNMSDTLTKQLIQKPTTKLQLMFLADENALSGTKGNKIWKRILPSKRSDRASGKLCRFQRIPFSAMSNTVPYDCLTKIFEDSVLKKPSKLTYEHLVDYREKEKLAYEVYRKKKGELKDKLMKKCAFTDLSAIPSKNLQRSFKRTLESYDFQPTYIPPDLSQYSRIFIFNQTS